MYISKLAEEKICDFYGVTKMTDLLESESDQLEDSVMDGFCRKCGAYYGDVEPDATDYHCGECNENAVDSLFMFMMMTGG